MLDFDSIPLEKRIQEGNKVMSQHPDRIPILVTRAKNCTLLPKLAKEKYLVKVDMTVGQFVSVIRKFLALKSEEAIFIFITKEGSGGIIPAMTAPLQNIYNEHKSEDHFLRITYNTESVYGNSL